MRQAEMDAALERLEKKLASLPEAEKARRRERMLALGIPKGPPLSREEADREILAMLEGVARGHRV